jgi:hypothetical protein
MIRGKIEDEEEASVCKGSAVLDIFLYFTFISFY